MTLQMGKIIKPGVDEFDIRENQITYYFPAIWGKDDDGHGGNGVEDAGTIYFCIDESEGYGDLGFITSITLQELVEDVLDGFAYPGEENISDPEHIADAKRIVAALRSAADWLENRCAKVVPQKMTPAGTDMA